MSVLYIAIPIALLFAASAIGAFIWAVHDGQLDDVDSASARMLDDD